MFIFICICIFMFMFMCMFMFVFMFMFIHTYRANFLEPARESIATRVVGFRSSAVSISAMLYLRHN